MDSRRSTGHNCPGNSVEFGRTAGVSRVCAQMRTRATASSAALCTCACVSAVEKRFNGQQRAASVDFFCVISGVTQCEAAAPLAGGLSALLWCVKPSFPGFHVGAALELKERQVAGGVYRECLCIKRRESLNNVKFRRHVSLAQVVSFLVARHFNFSTDWKKKVSADVCVAVIFNAA